MSCIISASCSVYRVCVLQGSCTVARIVLLTVNLSGSYIVRMQKELGLLLIGTAYTNTLS